MSYSFSLVRLLDSKLLRHQGRGTRVLPERPVNDPLEDLGYSFEGPTKLARPYVSAEILENGDQELSFRQVEVNRLACPVMMRSQRLFPSKDLSIITPKNPYV